MQDNSSDPKRTNSFKAIIYFQEGCEMENVRAFGVIHNLEDIASEIRHVPEDVMIPEAWKSFGRKDLPSISGLNALMSMSTNC